MTESEARAIASGLPGAWMAKALVTKWNTYWVVVPRKEKRR
jgi:hypothetical protein